MAGTAVPLKGGSKPTKPQPGGVPPAGISGAAYRRGGAPLARSPREQLHASSTRTIGALFQDEHSSEMVGTSDPVSSEDELVVEEEEPAAPKAEPGTRPAGSHPAIPPAVLRFPPHEHIIDGDEQQWVYYHTRTDGELVGTIASTFEADTDEVIESNVSRYSNLRRKSKLKRGTLLVIGACDTLLLCSTCRCDERTGDPILICRENW